MKVMDRIIAPTSAATTVKAMGGTSFPTPVSEYRQVDHDDQLPEQQRPAGFLSGGEDLVEAFIPRQLSAGDA